MKNYRGRQCFRSSTSGWGVCVGADRTGSTEETTEFKGSDVAMAAAVCTGSNVDVTDVDTSWASESAVSPGDNVGNTCTDDTVASS